MELKNAISNYDVNSNNLEWGHNMADAILKGKNLEKTTTNCKEDGILKYTPRFVNNSPKKRTLMKGELGRLRKAGFEVKKPSDILNMRTPELWNYYISVLRENNFFKR